MLSSPAIFIFSLSYALLSPLSLFFLLLLLFSPYILIFFLCSSNFIFSLLFIFFVARPLSSSHILKFSLSLFLESSSSYPFLQHLMSSTVQHIFRFQVFVSFFFVYSDLLPHLFFLAYNFIRDVLFYSFCILRCLSFYFFV